MEHRAGVSPRGSSEQPETQSWCAPACCFEFINLSAKQYGAPTLYCSIYTSTYYWQVGTDKPLWPLRIFTLGYVLPAAAHWLLTWRGWWVRPKYAAAASILYHETWLLSLCELVITWHESLISKVLSGNSLVVQWLGLRWSRFNPWLGNPEKHNPPLLPSMGLSVSGALLHLKLRESFLLFYLQTEFMHFHQCGQ